LALTYNLIKFEEENQSSLPISSSSSTSKSLKILAIVRGFLANHLETDSKSNKRWLRVVNVIHLIFTSNDKNFFKSSSQNPSKASVAALEVSTNISPSLQS
jgi:hypothetical protein